MCGCMPARPRPAQLHALAYTQGTDIHVGPGQEEHLPHEALACGLREAGAVRATMQMKGVGVNDDPSLEREADSMGQAAMHGRAVAYVQRTDIHADPGLEQNLLHGARMLVPHQVCCSAQVVQSDHQG